MESAYSINSCRTHGIVGYTIPTVMALNNMGLPRSGVVMRQFDEEIATLRFDGERFREHSLDVECTQELLAYKKLILECAKELWRRRNPGRKNLPKGFGDAFTLFFSEVQEGSAVVPLKRRIECSDDQLELPPRDEFDDAAELIDASIEAVGNDGKLPDLLPRNVIPLFRDFGKTLTVDETLFTRSHRRNTEAVYSPQVRERLANWTETVYEDLVDLTGEVRMAQLDGGQFKLLLADGRTAAGKFPPAQEALVLEALSRHSEVRLHIKGLAEFNEMDRSLRRVIRVDDAQIVIGAELSYDDSIRPIWETVSELGASVPKKAWESLPADLSKHVDDYLHRSGKTS